MKERDARAQVMRLVAEEGAVPNHGHSVTTETITYVTGVDFVAKTVTTATKTVVVAVGGVS